MKRNKIIIVLALCMLYQVTPFYIYILILDLVIDSLNILLDSLIETNRENFVIEKPETTENRQLILICGLLLIFISV
jgi:hypothetical protein